MKVRIISAGAAVLAGLVLCTPAWALCLPVWGTICRPATSPSEQASSETTSNKLRKPLNLRKFVRNGTAVQWRAKRTRIAQSRHPVVTAKAPRAHKTIVFARSRRAAAPRLAAARRPVMTLDKPLTMGATKWPNDAPPEEADRAPPGDTAANARAPERDATTNGASVNDEARPQDELNPLDLAADARKPDSQATPAPRGVDALTAEAPPAGTVAANNPAPTPESNPAPAPSAAPQVPPAPTAAPAPPAPTADASPAKNRTEVSAPAPQPPAEETSWLRRIAIGVGGLITLASAVRLFAG